MGDENISFADRQSRDRFEQKNQGDELIDAGSVTKEFQELPSHKCHRAVTTQRLAFLLVWIMGISVAVHYLATTVLVLYGKDSASESLRNIFNTWLPVISGLVGGAATYYFTKEK